MNPNLAANIQQIQKMLEEGGPLAECAATTLEDMLLGIFSRALVVDQSMLPRNRRRPVSRHYHSGARRLLSATTVDLWRPSSDFISVGEAITDMFRSEIEPLGIAALQGIVENLALVPDTWKSSEDAGNKHIIFAGDVVRLSANPLDKERVLVVTIRESSIGLHESPLTHDLPEDSYFAVWKPNAKLPDAD